MPCTPSASNGPNHLGLFALQGQVSYTAAWWAVGLGIDLSLGAGPHNMTILQDDGPNDVGLWSNALSRHQTALITSGCVRQRCSTTPTRSPTASGRASRGSRRLVRACTQHTRTQRAKPNAQHADHNTQHKTHNAWCAHALGGDHASWFCSPPMSSFRCPLWRVDARLDNATAAR